MKHLVLETDEEIRCVKCGAAATQGTVYDSSQVCYCNGDSCKKYWDPWNTPESVFIIRKICP